MMLNNTGQVQERYLPSDLMISRLPDEGLEKFENFNRVFKIYFKNQTDAGRILKVGQASIFKYLSGKVLLPREVADRFSKFTNGDVNADDIYFDYNAYVYDQKHGVSVEEKRI